MVEQQPSKLNTRVRFPVPAPARAPAAVAAPRVSERNTAKADAEQGFIASPEGQALASTYGHVFNPVAEIGTVAGVEWLGDGRLLAAAEPVRRGGGSAGVVTPSG